MTVNYQYCSMQFLTPDECPAVNDPEEISGDDLDACFKLLVESGKNVVVRCSDNYIRRLAEYIHNNYINVKAAGGLVRNSDGKLLMMMRNGRADLPKGKVEIGETLAQAALRETKEETGLDCLQLGQLILKTYHIYNLYGGWHFKQTSWFDMYQRCQQPLVPQLEEGITQCEWLTPEDWRCSLENSYATMRMITSKSFAVL